MDTCFATGGAALLDGETVMAARGFSGAEGHVVHLPETLDHLMRETGWGMAELDRIGVTIGPGTFSGARIGLGMAKGFALAWGIRVVGVSTLELVAAGAGGEGLVATILDARRGEVYAAVYETMGEGDPVPRMAPGVWNPDHLAAKLLGWQQESGILFRLTGDGLGVYGERFAPLLEQGCRLVDPALWSVDLGLLGRMAGRRKEHPPVAVASLEPLYVRRADAREPAKPDFTPP